MKYMTKEDYTEMRIKKGKPINIYDYAFGLCIQCSNEVKYSIYWVWFGPVGMYFISDQDIPLCGIGCSMKYNEENNNGDDI